MILFGELHENEMKESLPIFKNHWAKIRRNQSVNRADPYIHTKKSMKQNIEIINDQSILNQCYKRHITFAHRILTLQAHPMLTSSNF